METKNSIGRSKLWHEIFNIVNRVKLEKQSGDSIDKSSLTTMLENKINLLQEDLESIHLYLDDLHIPRKDEKDTLSVVGRIKYLQNQIK